MIGESEGVVRILFGEVPEDGIAEEGLWGGEGDLGKEFKLIASVGGKTEPDHFWDEEVVGIFTTFGESE